MNLYGSQGRWWTKDASILHGATFRNGQKAGIGLLHKIFDLSKRSGYDVYEVKVSHFVMWTYDEAIKFYRSIGEDISTYLVKVANILEQSKYSYAIQVLKGPPISKSVNKNDIHIMLLEIMRSTELLIII